MMHMLLNLIQWLQLWPLVCSYKIWSTILKAEIKRLFNTVNLWLLLVATLFRWPNIIEALSYIVPYELSAECIIVKLSAYSILDDNRKIPIDCGKCHVKHDVTVLLT